MFIRDYVSSKERLSGLQPKCTSNKPFNKKRKLINKKMKNAPKKCT